MAVIAMLVSMASAGAWPHPSCKLAGQTRDRRSLRLQRMGFSEVSEDLSSGEVMQSRLRFIRLKLARKRPQMVGDWRRGLLVRYASLSGAWVRVERTGAVKVGWAGGPSLELEVSREDLERLMRAFQSAHFDEMSRPPKERGSYGAASMTLACGRYQSVSLVAYEGELQPVVAVLDDWVERVRSRASEGSPSQGDEVATRSVRRLQTPIDGVRPIAHVGVVGDRVAAKLQREDRTIDLSGLEPDSGLRIPVGIYTIRPENGVATGTMIVDVGRNYMECFEESGTCAPLGELPLPGGRARISGRRARVCSETDGAIHELPAVVEAGRYRVVDGQRTDMIYWHWGEHIDVPGGATVQLDCTKEPGCEVRGAVEVAGSQGPRCVGEIK